MSGSAGVPRDRGRRPGGVRLVATALGGLLFAVCSPAAWAQAGGRPPEGRPEERFRVQPLERTPQEAQGREGTAHEVRRGDTLWDLARRYLSDAWRWPEIFRLNREVVEDPHWIYPGEILRIPPGRPPAGEGAPGPAASGAEAGTLQEKESSGRRAVSGFGGASVFDRSPDAGDVLGPLDVGEPSPSPLVTSSDLRRAPFLADPRGLGPLAVTARKLEENPLGLALPPALRQNDQVVLRLGGLPVATGQTMQAVRWGRRLGRHGRIVAPVAVLRVSEVAGDSARAVVLELFGSYQVGDPVIPARPFHVDPALRRAAVEGGLVATVIGFGREQTLVGRGDVVFLDAGDEAGVRPGDEFAVFSVGSTAATARWEDRLAVVRVVRVEAATSTAVVVDLQDVGVRPGAPVRMVFRATGG